MEAQRRPPHFNRKQHLGHQVVSVQLQHPHQEHLVLHLPFKRVQLTCHLAEEASARQLVHSVNLPRRDSVVSRLLALLELLLALVSGLHLGLDNLRALGLVPQQPAPSDNLPPVHSELHQLERSAPLHLQASVHHRVVSGSRVPDSEPPPHRPPLVSPQRQLHPSAPRRRPHLALLLLVPSALLQQGLSVHQLVQVLVSLLGLLELRQRPLSVLLLADLVRPLASVLLNNSRYSIFIYAFNL